MTAPPTWRGAPPSPCRIAYAAEWEIHRHGGIDFDLLPLGEAIEEGSDCVAKPRRPISPQQRTAALRATRRRPF